MNKKIIIALSILAAALLIYFLNPQIIGNLIESPQKTMSGQSKPVTITQENFPGYLQKQQIIQELPKSAVISLRIYNFDTGERTWVGDYTITKGSVLKGLPESPDAEVIIHSKYAGKLVSNFCQAIQQAKTNGDFAFELKTDKTSLLWKYRGMMKYKDCFA